MSDTFVLQADGSLWHSMLERDSVPQTEELHSADLSAQAAWGKGNHAHGVDLFGGGSEMPEAWATQVGLVCVKMYNSSSASLFQS